MVRAKYELDWEQLSGAAPIWSQLTRNEQEYAIFRRLGCTIEEARYKLQWSRRYLWDVQRSLYAKVKGENADGG